MAGGDPEVRAADTHLLEAIYELAAHLSGARAALGRVLPALYQRLAPRGELRLRTALETLARAVRLPEAPREPGAVVVGWMRQQPVVVVLEGTSAFAAVSLPGLLDAVRRASSAEQPGAVEDWLLDPDRGARVFDLAEEAGISSPEMAEAIRVAVQAWRYHGEAGR